MVYVCSGTESVQNYLSINIAVRKLTEQEPAMQFIPGSWVSDAKRYFSKSGCVAYNIGSDYLNGSPPDKNF